MGGLSKTRRHADDFLSIATVRGPAARHTFCSRAATEVGSRGVYTQAASEDVMSSSENGQEIDKSAFRRILYSAKLLLELVELMGIEPMTS